MSLLLKPRRPRGNLVDNGFFDHFPTPNNAPTVGNHAGFIVGNPASLPGRGNVFGWSATLVGLGASVQIDPTVKANGSASLRLACSLDSYIEARSNGARGYHGYAGFKVTEGTQLRCRFKIKTQYNSGTSLHGAYVKIMWHGVGASDAGSTDLTPPGIYIQATQPFVQYDVTVIVPAGAIRANLEPRLYGHTGDGTLDMVAWFTDFMVFPASQTEMLLM